jgi:hypothetical protein
MEGCKLVSRLAGSLLALWRLSFTLHTTFHPHLRMSTDVSALPRCLFLLVLTFQIFLLIPYHYPE